MINLEIVCDDDKYLPMYANDTDACMDLKVKCGKSGKVITPNGRAVFGTGIKVKIPENHVMLIFPRSSTGFKLRCMFTNGTGIIDSGYRDEIKIELYNFGDYSTTIEDGQRVAQCMIIPRPKINLIRVLDDVNFRENDRGGGLGSSGK